MTDDTVDINCDMGESFGSWRIGDDPGVMPLITTANVACGFHAGDAVTMERTVALAKEHGVAVGAHPGAPDLLGFGRRVMALTEDDVHAYIVYQVGALRAFLDAAGMTLAHVKPHGAMYLMMKRPELARAAVKAIKTVAPAAPLFWPGPIGREPLTAIATESGLEVVGECYPDLEYAPDGSIILERSKHAIDPGVVRGRVEEVLRDGVLTVGDGATVPMGVRSFCVHGDGPDPVATANAVREAARACCATLASAGVTTSSG